MVISNLLQIKQKKEYSTWCILNKEHFNMIPKISHIGLTAMAFVVWGRDRVDKC